MSIETYTAEFRALEEVIKQYERVRMTPPVDDDFPTVLGDYDHACRALIDAFKLNGRMR